MEFINMRKTIYIWLDDERTMPVFDKDWYKISCKSYKECIKAINMACDNDEIGAIYIDFDNDLGGKLEGYDVAKWIVKNGIIIEYRVHSMNPVARQNITQLLDHYGYGRFKL